MQSERNDFTLSLCFITLPFHVFLKLNHYLHINLFPRHYYRSLGCHLEFWLLNVVCAMKTSVAITTQQLVAKIVLALDLGLSFVWKFGFGGVGGLVKSEKDQS